MGLYVGNQKIGTVINPILSEETATFTIERINYAKPFDGPINFPPMEFRHYILQIEHVDFLGTRFPSPTPEATGVRGKILTTTSTTRK